MPKPQNRKRISAIIRELCRLSRDGWQHARADEYGPLEAELRKLTQRTALIIALLIACSATALNAKPCASTEDRAAEAVDVWPSEVWAQAEAQGRAAAAAPLTIAPASFADVPRAVCAALSEWDNQSLWVLIALIAALPVSATLAALWHVGRVQYEHGFNEGWRSSNDLDELRTHNAQREWEDRHGFADLA